MTDVRPEGGLRNHRVEWIEETTNGVCPDDPDWNAFSDVVRSVDWSPDPTVEPQRGIGDADPISFFPGPESHSIAITYDLQQAFLDGSGNRQDASSYALQRDSDNMISNSHCIVDREEKTDQNDNTIRTYTVGKGGLIGTLTISGDAGDSNPIQPQLDYTFEKVRSYKVQQPSSSTLLTIVSTDSGDNSQTLTIEDEGAGTTESVSLNGTTNVSTTSSFGDIDALDLDSETTGNVEIYENDGSQTNPSQGTKLAEIKGKDEYQNVGDLGIPALGSGSHNADSLTGDFIRFHGSTLERPSGTDLALEIQSAEFTVENNLEQTPRVDDIIQSVFPGVRDSTITATVFGEDESHTHIVDSLTNNSDNVIWDLGAAGKIQLDSAHITDPPSRTVNGEEAIMSLDVTYSGTGLTISKP